MTRTELLHKTIYDGVSKDSEIAHQVHAAVPLVTELIQDYTGLTFKSPVVFRLVSPHHLIRLNKAWISEELSLLDSYQDDIPVALNVARKILPPFIGGCMRLMWRGLAGQNIHRTPGGNEIIIVPRAARHLGMQAEHVTTTIAHELTHALQQDALDDRARHLASVFTSGSKSGRRYVSEGQATWVHELTSAELYGAPITSMAHRPSLALKASRTVVRTVIPALADRKYYTDGHTFVKTVVEAGGRDLVNRAWQSPDNVPTVCEIYDPQSWIDRMTGTTAREGQTP